MALIWWTFGPEADQQRKMLSGLVFALLMLPAASALCWVFMLDRDTLAGAVRDPESSIEGKWYEKAVFGAFHDLIALCGLGAMALGLLRIDVEPVMLLVGGRSAGCRRRARALPGDQEGGRLMHKRDSDSRAVASARSRFVQPSKRAES
ncbi:hypothetical protein [Glutamicibacter nicotianae]|uniref:hypothetical protein n=1 Tax=Glutamicibacter nicotianae TaxID=37929 RepID=UPI002556DA24|nr:hypothetical protein [Glutamicibacter nicotianae]WIV44149.1 hypothetical protein QQS42_00565 [Glutamicibacter nicotianae]